MTPAGVREFTHRGHAAIVEAGIADAIHLRNGLNVCAGAITHRAVAAGHGFEHVDPLAALTA